jgi:hypothetical protein
LKPKGIENMNRTEEELDELIQELGKHHGEDNFAIVKDIVLANDSLPELDLFDLIATVLGASAYVRVPRVLQRPKSGHFESPEVGLGNSPFPPFHAPSSVQKDSPSGSKQPFRSFSRGKNPNKQERDARNHKEVKEPKPIESIWKTVVKEHHADSFPDKPLTHDPNVDTHFEAFDVEQLEDVDPVALAIQQNPDFFAPVIPMSSYPALFPPDEPLSISSSSLNPSSNALQAQNSSEPFSASKLASQTLLLGEEEETTTEKEEIPAYLLSSVHGAPPKLSSSSSLSASQAPSVASSSHLMSSGNLKSSAEDAKSQISSSSIDFYLPAPPATEEEAKHIKDRLNASVRASSHWGASGDYGIAPSPLLLRESLNSSMGGSSIERPIEVIDLTNLPDWKVDQEALDFLGQIFPDFEVKYLIDCLAGANNDIQLVSDFLMPVMMEEIEVDTNFNDAPYDYSQHMYDSTEYPQYQFPSHMIEDGNMEYVEDVEDGMDETIEISDEDELPEADAAFNENYHALVEIYPEVDRDWVLDALINTENNLERAADLLMRGLAHDVIDIQDDDGSAQGGKSERGRAGRRGKNRKQRRIVPLSAPNAWARPLTTESSASLSEYPVLSAYNDMEVDPAALKGPIRIRPPQPSGVRQVASDGPELLPRGGFGPKNARLNMPRRVYMRQMEDNVEAPRYVPNEGRSEPNSWASMVVQANILFEQSSKGASNAVAAFSRNRAGARYLISALQATNESWIALMEQAGKAFYLSGLAKLDLHSLRLRPASKLVAAILQAHWEHGSSERVLTIISGRGAHSADGISRIKEDVKRQVAEYEHVWVNPGCVRLVLPKPLV